MYATCLLSLMALAPVLATAQGSSAGLRPSQVQACVAAHAMPGDAYALFEALPSPEAEAELRRETQRRGVAQQDMALMLARDAQAVAWDESEAKATAWRVFAQCVRRVWPKASEAQVHRCEEDLYALPVILLYRADGLSRAAAAADIVRGGAPGEDARMQARMPLMLQFTYQGAGPAPGKARPWIDQQVAVWTAQCLMEADADGRS